MSKEIDDTFWEWWSDFSDYMDGTGGIHRENRIIMNTDVDTLCSKVKGIHQKSILKLIEKVLTAISIEDYSGRDRARLRGKIREIAKEYLGGKIENTNTN